MQQSSLNRLVNEIKVIDTASVISEFCYLKTSYPDDLTIHDAVVTEGLKPESDLKKKPLKTLNKLIEILQLVQPHNMEVERGFNITGDILRKKRSHMNHSTYRSLKIVKRSFSTERDILQLADETVWGKIKPFIQQASRNHEADKI